MAGMVGNKQQDAGAQGPVDLVPLTNIHLNYLETSHLSVEPVGAKVLYWQAFSAVSSTMSMDCFSGLPVLPVLMYCVGLDRGLLRHFGDGLQRSGLEFTLHDRLDGVVAAVKAHDDHVVAAGGDQRSLGAQRHRVVAGR